MNAVLNLRAQPPRRLAPVPKRPGTLTAPLAQLREERLEIASQILTTALHLSGLKRGAIAVWVPGAHARAQRFRIVHRTGFEREATPILAELLSESMREGRPRAMRGQRHAYTSWGRRQYLGGGAVIPLSAGGRILGALLMDDPSREVPMGAFEARHVIKFVCQGARVLLDAGRETTRRAS